MFDILVKTLITFCVIYTIIELVSALVNMVMFPAGNVGENVFVVVKVCNQEDRLEGIIRNIIWYELNSLNGGFVPNIVIVDMGSDDCTRLIGERLSDDYSFIYYTTVEEYDKFMSEMMF